MILGIDPGIRKLGFAIIDKQLNIHDAGILTFFDTTKFSREKQYHRMLDILNYFTDILTKYPIKAISIEKYYITSFNKKNAEFVYGMRGIILTLALQHKIKILEYSPIELKKNITGNGKASKETIQKIVMKLFKLQNIPEYHDTADALALAYIGLHHIK